MSPCVMASRYICFKKIEMVLRLKLRLTNDMTRKILRLDVVVKLRLILCRTLLFIRIFKTDTSKRIRKKLIIKICTK